ncbi:lipid droplet-associated protein [Gordonia sp. (in: high G+C Gram-positive bacteria)]|uniref:lipid droplet-associated protein n=1 Tax=Gordonia sp. (in: high G+C Gram-positive bacteria) TaxID=84139 RepID=UPI0016B525DD|nr:lipid droplet-associated protein [Gordonia sp. (in: high G+C Gram-positive bacteria)]NLG46121.1 lipid droplet-associated protein [Gordonia sp. (in: high G+C Gram-positive bacteria)]
MSRTPYPARVAAGLVATTIEETRKLPTRVITLPMSAVSRSLQAGMRLQQNIAELAIKGDEFLAPFCDKADEQPEWARFDEDEVAADTSAPLLADAPATLPTEPARKAVDASAAPAKKPAPATTAPAAEPDAKSVADESKGTPTNGTAPSGSGRFALYSSAPAGLEPGDTGTSADDADGPLPETVEALDYPHLTLAQLRAKVRGLGTDELSELLAFEKAGRNRTPFVTMIDNRIASQQKKSESAQ